MQLQLSLPFIVAIATSYFASGAQAYDHEGSAIMHDIDYNNCIDPSGDYHDTHPGDLAEIGPCYSPPYGPGIFLFNNGDTTVQAVGSTPPCLDAGNSPQVGNPVTFEACHPGAPGQQWVFKNDTNTFVVAGYDLCLNLPNNDVTPGTQLDIATCVDGSPAQFWPPHDFPAGN